MKKEGHKSVTKTLLYIGSVVILILAAVSFVVIPAMLPGKQTQLPPLGSYKNKKIEYVQGSYFLDAVAYYEQQKKNSNKTGRSQESDLFDIFNSAFRDTVITLAFSDQVKRSGYKAPEPLVERSMLPYFYNANGVYSAKIFRDTPDSRKAEIRKEVENRLVYSRYANDIGNLKTSAAEIQFISDMGVHKRSFNAAFFSTADYPQSEAALFGTNNAQLFTVYDLSIITLNSEAEAKKILSQLKNNELVFADAVSEYSTKQYSDASGKLNESYYYRLKNLIKSEEQLAKITELASGSLSDVTETSFGFSIFYANGESVQPDFTSAEMLNVVQHYMSIYEAGIIEDYYINIAKDFSAKAAVEGFFSAASQFNAQTSDIPLFPINYGNVPLLSPLPVQEVPQLSQETSNESFLQTAFSLTEGELSSPLVTGKNITVLRLKKIENDDAAAAGTMNFMYPYYVSQSDSAAVQSYFMRSPHLKNNLFNVFFKYFINS